ncbi:MAG: sodium:solute symporter family protein [Halanaerobiales bacterium]
MVFTTIIIYMLILLGVGYWANKQIEVMDDFLLAGRRLGLLLTSGALAATHFGGGMVMGGGEYGFIHGLSGAWYGISCGIGLILLGFLTASDFRSLAFYTVPDYLEYRYKGKSLRTLGALLSLIAIIGIIAAQVLSARGALAILGFTGNTGAIIATIVFIVYTALGGLWAASITDFIQVIIAGVGVIIASSLVLGNTGGFSGLNQMIQSSREGVSSGYFNILGMGAKSILWLLLPTVMYTLIGQDFYQRLFAAKDNITAKKASFVGGIFLIIMSIFPAIAGMGAKGFFPELTDGGQAIPKIIQEMFPVGVGAIVLAALLAAIMSTADSLLTAGTSHIIKDFWLEFTDIEKDNNKKELLKISRIFTVVLGLAALIIAVSVPTIIDALIYSYTMYTAGVFIPVIGGVLWKKATREGALSALLVGAATAIFGIIGNVDIAGIPVEIYSALLALILFIIISLMTYKPESSENQN